MHDTASILRAHGSFGKLSDSGPQSAMMKKTALKDSWKLMLNRAVGDTSRMMMALRASGCRGSVVYCRSHATVKTDSMMAALTSETGLPATSV